MKSRVLFSQLSCGHGAGRDFRCRGSSSVENSRFLPFGLVSLFYLDQCISFLCLESGQYRIFAQSFYPPQGAHILHFEGFLGAVLRVHGAPVRDTVRCCHFSRAELYYCSENRPWICKIVDTCVAQPLANQYNYLCSLCFTRRADWNTDDHCEHARNATLVPFPFIPVSD